MITAVNTMLSDKLTKAGFEVYEEYSAAKPLKAGVYTALWRTERLTLGEYRQAANANSKCSAAVKVHIRLLGGKKKFRRRGGIAEHGAQGGGRAVFLIAAGGNIADLRSA